jgi:hypothetical protein
MPPDRCQLALKEWAVTVQALAQGRQVLLLRKGGIHEPGKSFQVASSEFVLYPTYEHQREDLIKDQHRHALREVLEEPRQEDRITFRHWARVEEAIEVSGQADVERLSPHFIWTVDYAQSRLRWKPMLPLSVLLLRVYAVEQPVTVRFLPEYRGCSSWVDVLDPVPLGRLEPVLDDQDFGRRVAEIKECLSTAVSS